MRKVILFVATSLDGFIARKDGNIDWLFSDQDYGYKAFYESIGITLSGRKTYELIRSFDEFPYPGKVNYVFSRKTKALTDHQVILIKEDAAEFTTRLKQDEGEDIWLVGGGEIVTILQARDLIDEYIISIHPILLGEGIRLFLDSANTTRLHLAKCESFESGLVQLHYAKG
jgi:dihydrofolate reductase